MVNFEKSFKRGNLGIFVRQEIEKREKKTKHSNTLKAIHFISSRFISSLLSVRSLAFQTILNNEFLAGTLRSSDFFKLTPASSRFQCSLRFALQANFTLTPEFLQIASSLPFLTAFTEFSPTPFFHPSLFSRRRLPFRLLFPLGFSIPRA